MRDAAGWAPGRVNLMGEHTDYNGGLVLPVPLELGIEVVLQRATELSVKGRAADALSTGLAEAVCDELGVDAGVAARVEADLPAGAGLASSAAFEVAFARALRELHGLRADDRELALACHRAESRFVRCGVMDQISAALGRHGAALLIDCATLATREITLPADAEFAVLDSGVRHANAQSAYEGRREECERAAALLGVQALAQAQSIEGLPAALERRARHVVGESAATARAAAALAEGDVELLAALMRASHSSQRDLFEVSVPEVDDLVERAQAAGALAARLTGGGFGGAVVALCPRGQAAAVAEDAGAPLLATAGPA